MVTLVLVRHGEAEGNTEHRFIGQTDVPLTVRGQSQVERLTRRLIDRPITRVVSSDLRRCRDTVGPTAEALGLELELEPRIREISNGEWNNLLAAEIQARWPTMFDDYARGVDVARPGGERWIDVSHRVIDALTDIAADATSGETILIGTHAGPTLAAVRWAAAIPVNGNVFRGPFGSVENTGISVISFPGPRLAIFNDAAHLED